MCGEIPLIFKFHSTYWQWQNAKKIFYLQNALDELVVQCSPSDPPYSLLCILEDLRKNAPSLRLETSCHLHSSLTSGTSQDELLDFLSQHTEGGEEGRCLRLRIIWRKSKLLTCAKRKRIFFFHSRMLFFCSVLQGAATICGRRHPHERRVQPSSPPRQTVPSRFILRRRRQQQQKLPPL